VVFGRSGGSPVSPWSCNPSNSISNQKKTNLQRNPRLDHFSPSTHQHRTSRLTDTDCSNINRSLLKSSIEKNLQSLPGQSTDRIPQLDLHFLISTSEGIVRDNSTLASKKTRENLPTGQTQIVDDFSNAYIEHLNQRNKITSNTHLSQGYAFSGFSNESRIRRIRSRPVS
jgi:hypothetical protein